MRLTVRAHAAGLSVPDAPQRETERDGERRRERERVLLGGRVDTGEGPGRSPVTGPYICVHLYVCMLLHMYVCASTYIYIHTPGGALADDREEVICARK